MRAMSVLAALLAIPLSAVAAGGTFTLSIFEGFDFASRRVVKSGADTADLNFTYQTRRIGFIGYLSAAKISYFESAPGAISATEVSSWKDYVAGPEPGYYVVRARSDQRLYLVHLVEFANQGKAASYWKMRFEWQELGGSDRDREPRSDRASNSRYSDDRPDSRSADERSDFRYGNDRRASRHSNNRLDGRGRADREQQISYSRDSQSASAGSRASSSADNSLRRAGHDVSYEARRRVAVEIELNTPLTAGLGGELKWIALCEPGTREKVGSDMILPSLKMTLSVPPGRYDLWIEGRNNKSEMLRSVDLSGYKIGDVVSTAVRFPGWGALQRDSSRSERAAEPESLPSRTSESRRSTSSYEAGRPASDGSEDIEQRIRRAQEKAGQRSQSTDADIEERIRRAQEKAARRNQ